MAGGDGRIFLDTALGPLNDELKFFIAHLPFSARPLDIREYFSTFGTVNFVKLVFDKSGKSKGYGFLYMNDRVGDAAVEDFARSNNNRITLLNKSGVFLARNDRKRQNPIRNPKSRGHDDRYAGAAGRSISNQNSMKQYTNPSHDYHAQDPSWNQTSLAAVGTPPPGTAVPHYSQDLPPAQPPEFSYQYAPPAQHIPQAPHMSQVSNTPHVPSMTYGVGSINPRPSHLPFVQTFPLTTKVFLENLPLTSTPDDICNCLFQYSLNVVQCTMEYDNDAKASWCYAHIDFSIPEEANRCIALAQQSLLEYRGRILTASEDSNFQLPGPVPASQPVLPASNYIAPVPQYRSPVSHQPPHSNYTVNGRNGESRGRHAGRGRGHNRNRSNRRHRPY